MLGTVNATKKSFKYKTVFILCFLKLFYWMTCKFYNLISRKIILLMN